MACGTGHAAPTEPVDPGNLALVFYPEGILSTNGQGTWIERGSDGEIRSQLVETQRSWESVLLKDYQRQIELELNLSHRYIFFLNPGTDKTPLHRITGVRALADSKYFRVSARIKGADKCLEAYRSAQLLIGDAGSDSLPGQRFDPAFVDCNDSLAQRWSIARAGDFNGGATYAWRNQHIEFADLDLCLTSRGQGGVLAMTRCRGARSQRWLHVPPAARAPVMHLRSLDEPKTWCMALSSLGAADLPGEKSRSYVPDYLPKIAAQCQDGSGGPVPALRFSALPP